ASGLWVKGSTILTPQGPHLQVTGAVSLINYPLDWEKTQKTNKAKKTQPKKEFTLKYEKPKILLIDLPNECLDQVRLAGFNALAGTFGSPYKVSCSDNLEPVIGEPFLPNCAEQEIIVVDLTPPNVMDQPKGEKFTSQGEKDLWAKCNRGEIDPRPRCMNWVRSDFDRILSYGGFFVIFAQPRFLAKSLLGKCQILRTIYKRTRLFFRQLVVSFNPVIKLSYYTFGIWNGNCCS
ncbi:MAG: hypothetical protein ACW963_07860, partial [Candidatus Sifarchaeia archaeon]